MNCLEGSGFPYSIKRTCVAFYVKQMSARSVVHKSLPSPLEIFAIFCRCLSFPLPIFTNDSTSKNCWKYMEYTAILVSTVTITTDWKPKDSAACFGHKNTFVSAFSWFDGKLVSSLQIIWNLKSVKIPEVYIQAYYLTSTASSYRSTKLSVESVTCDYQTDDRIFLLNRRYPFL